jgi:hypothetical protein
VDVSKVASWLSARRKAIAALVVPLAVFYAAKYGLNLTAEQAAGLGAILGGGVTYAVPNTPPGPITEA